MSERYILVESPKKLRFKISVSIDRQAIGNDTALKPLQKEEFEAVLKSKAPSWKITCTSFSWVQKWEIGNRFYYDLITELIVQPQVENVKPLVFVHFRSIVPFSLLSTAEIIDFDGVVATMFSVPTRSVNTYFMEQEITDYVPPSPPDSPSSPETPTTKQKFPWWVVIVMGVIALLIFTMTRR